MNEAEALAARPSLPDNYIAAKRALRRCAKDFTPENFVVATAALEAALDDDQCASIASDVVRLATYNKIANDGELERLANKISQKRREWKESIA
jgi:hypothetical protein